MTIIVICARRENGIRGNILTPCIVDLIFLPRTCLYFSAYLPLSFGVSLGGLKVFLGCTSYLNFLSIAHFAATLSKVFSCRAFFAEHCPMGICGLLPQSQFCAQTLIPQLSQQPNSDVHLWVVFYHAPNCSLTKGTPGYSQILLPGIAQT